MAVNYEPLWDALSDILEDPKTKIDPKLREVGLEAIATAMEERDEENEAKYRLKIEIEVEALSYSDALEVGLDLLLEAPSVMTEITNLKTGKTKRVSSSKAAPKKGADHA